MKPGQVPPEVLALAKTLPRFDDGRIDYHTSSEAVVLNCLLLCNEKLLVLHRSDRVGWHKNRWHVVAGFLDEEKSLEAKALEEIREELGVTKLEYSRIAVYGPTIDTDSHKRWTVYTVLLEIESEPQITLDWENTEFAWVPLHDLARYDLMPGILRALHHLRTQD
jgi:8-oxo-dGTP pyrophosphatase MutT (NUDIX family)